LNTQDLNAAGNAELVFLGRRMVEVGPRQSIDTRDGLRLLAGVEGEINPDWGFNIYGSHSRLDRDNVLENDVAESRFRQALLVTDDGTACQDPSGGCVPLNIFGAGNITEEASEFVRVGATNITSIEQDVINGSVVGSFDNPIDPNPIGIVFGAEYREDRSTFRPDTFLSTGDVLGFNAGQATEGSFDVWELFAEVDIPLVSDRPGVEYLGVWGAYRFSDYSNVGDVNSFAVTGNYQPIPDLRIRAGFQRATRAPNVDELFAGQAQGFPPATDPCTADNTANPSPELVAICEATGVPAGQTGVLGQTNTQIEGLFGGNPDLIEEESDTITIGAVYEPEFLEGFDASLDYYQIEIEDAIDELGGDVQGVLDVCLEELQDPSSIFCQAIDRRPDGNVDIVQVLNENIGKLETEGFDLHLNYVTPLQFGIRGESSTLALTYRGNFLTKFDVTPVAGLPRVNECDGVFGNICGRPRSEYTHNIRATWDSGPLTLSLLWRFLNEVEDDRIENEGVPADDIVVDELDSESYVDLTASYHFRETFRINAGVKNLFDNEPTPVGDVQEQANTFPEIYDVIGRRFFVSGRYTF